jgi:hypothetical protein
VATRRRFYHVALIASGSPVNALNGLHRQALASLPSFKEGSTLDLDSWALLHEDGHQQGVAVGYKRWSPICPAVWKPWPSGDNTTVGPTSKTAQGTGRTVWHRTAVRGQFLGHRGHAPSGHRGLQPVRAPATTIGTVGKMRTEHATLAFVWPGSGVESRAWQTHP